MQYNVTYREKDNSWQYIISYKDQNGKWKQKAKQGFEKSRKGKQDCKDAAEEALESLKKHEELSIPKEFEKITFEEFSNRYLDHIKIYKEFKTVQTTKTTLKKFSDLYPLELTKITSLDIQNIIDKITKEGLNPNTIKSYLQRLTNVFRAAKEQYNIIDNIPTLNIKTEKRKDIVKKALNQEELKDLLNKMSGSKYYMILYIAAYTGMRIGEILGLTWNNIDFAHNEIKVIRQWKKLKDGTFNFGGLKSKNSTRVIPISQDIAEKLKNYKATENIVGLDNRLFNFCNKDVVIASIDIMIKRTGYKISIHELRHTYATKLVANGLDFKTIAYIMGHDVQQTLQTYSHVNSDMLTKARDLIENIF
jgi:integrase